jgi:hypothetical protein
MNQLWQPQIVGGGPIFIAASDSLAAEQARADYICDGTADDVQIQAAIDAMPNGGKIVLASGDYEIASTVHIRQWLHISGAGMDTWHSGGDVEQHGSHLKLADGANCNMFELHPTADDHPYNLPRFEHMAIVGNKDNQSVATHAFYQHPGSGIDMRFYGIWFDSWKGSPIVLTQYWDHSICSCVCEHADTYFISVEPEVGVSAPTEIWVTNCYIKNTNGGIVTNGDYEIVGIHFIGNYAVVGSAYSSDMIHLINASNVVIGNNNLAGHGSNNSAVYLENVGSVAITGNIFYGGDRHISTGGTDDISRLTISGNVFTNYVYYAIRNYVGSPGTAEMVITGNTFSTSYTAATSILLRVSNHAIVTGNAFRASVETVSYINAATGITVDPIIRNNYFDTSGATDLIVFYATSNSRYCYSRHTEHFQDLLASSSTYIRNNEDLSAASPITFTIDAQPDVPRTITWELTHANITAFTLTIAGIDAAGEDLSSVFTQADGWSGETDAAFAVIASIKLSGRTGTGVGDTCDIGIGDKLGLSNVIVDSADVLKVKRNNAHEATGTVDTDNSTVDLSAINANDDITILYRESLNVFGT